MESVENMEKDLKTGQIGQGCEFFQQFHMNFYTKASNSLLMKMWIGKKLPDEGVAFEFPIPDKTEDFMKKIMRFWNFGLGQAFEDFFRILSPVPLNLTEDLGTEIRCGLGLWCLPKRDKNISVMILKI